MNHQNINSSEKNASIEVAIKQAEMMQLKLQLEIQYKNNMNFLKTKAPDIYQRFVSFKSKNQSLFIDNDGNPGLINNRSKNNTYNENAETFSLKQVDSFIKLPSRITMGFKKTTIVNPEHIHPVICNDAIDEYASLNFKTRYDPNDPIGLMIIVGCGLGYHIKELIKKYDIKNLLIYDSNEDSFYASLFTTDWKEIADIFIDKGGKVKIHVGEKPEETLAKMRTLSSEIGLYNMITTHIYKHTDSEDNEKFCNKIKKEFYIYGSSIGFFDDEQIAFSHTIANLNKNHPIFIKKENEMDLPPLIIIGNGPSLDTLVDFIQIAQKHCVIMSCGSALTSLYNIGITPDIHVELERNLTVAEMLKLGTSIEYTKNITLLALNNISPATTSLFKESYLAAKPNDNGSTIIQKIIEKTKFRQLSMCNPTVTNCGFSYALNLGFKEIYLAGTDLGKRDRKIHHSKYSIWHSLDSDKNNNKDSKETLEDYTYSESEFSVKGNFCEKITTTSVLDNSRKNMELLLRENPEIKVYNPNDGALINGTISVKPKDLELKKEKQINNKEELIKRILDNNFSKLNVEKITINNIKENYTTLFFRARKGLDLPSDCRNILELMNQFKRIFKNIKALERADETTAMIIQGSLQVLMGLIYYFCSRASTEEDFIKSYKIGKKYYDRLLNESSAILRDNPLRLDDTMLLKE